MLKRTCLIYFFGLFILIWNTNVNGDACDSLPPDVTITSEDCSSADFNESESCTLKCSAVYDGGHYTVSEMSWLYFVDDEDTSIELTDGVSNTQSTNKTVMSLKLSSYYSGTYSCQITLKDISKDSSCDVDLEKFDIANTDSPVSLGQPCKTASECVTFNADCDDGICKCASQYKNKYPNDDPIGCFADSNPNEPCNIDEQCQEGFECEDNVCACEETVIDVVISDDNKITMCLPKVEPNQNCTYNEQCESFDAHSKCVENLCKCVGDYADFDLDDDGHCYGGLSDAAIAGIAVAGVFALGVVAIILRYICEKCCCSGKKKDEDVERVEEKYN